MRIIRIFSIIAAIAAALALSAYNPQNPSEPGEVSVQVQVVPEGSARISMSNSGRGLPGTAVTLTASANNNYRFVRWESMDGELLSEDNRFQYVLPLTDSRVVARMEYVPASPGEPEVPTAYADVTTEVVPPQAGSINGGGRYAVGSTVSLRARAFSNYRFENWTIDGEVCDTETTIMLTVPESGLHVKANYSYVPGSPGEPESIARKYRLNLASNPSGTVSFNQASGNSFAAGEQVYLKASPHSNYVFERWTDADGTLLSESPTFYYVMPASDASVMAHARYAPGSPAEPSEPTVKRNVIYGSRCTQVAGTAFDYEISMDNIDEGTGISVDFVCPQGYSLAGVEPGERAALHTLSCENISAGSYRVSLRGAETIKGAGGVVLRLHLEPGDQTPEAGETVAVKLSKGVLVKADASQIAVDAVSGMVQIVAAPDVIPDGPDFTLSAVATDATSVNPGDTIDIRWTVANEGTAPAYGGWTENLWLVDADGKRAALGTVYYDTSMMAVGDRVSRNVSLAIPQLPGIDGNLGIAVSLTAAPEAGEHSSRQQNNSGATAGYPLSLARTLMLQIPETAAEGSDHNVRCRISRSGSWSQSETFRLALSPSDQRIGLPEQVTIARDQSAAYFQLNIADNDILDENSVYTVTASGNGYTPVASAITVVDNEYPEIGIEASATEITEGEQFELRLTLPVAAQEYVEISLSSDAPARLKMPSTVVIAKGNSEASVAVTAIDNNDIEDFTDISIRATAAHYQAGETFILLSDNDMPVLDMDIAPREVSEGAGPMAIRCCLRRLSNIDKTITVLLSDDSSNALTYTRQRITLEAGVEQVDFSIGVADNDRVDGDRTVTISAAVFLSGCSCSASGRNGGTVSRAVTIIDNDGPSLSMTASRSTLRKDSRTTELTISRNTPVTSAQEVRLSADTEGILSMPELVVIPAGKKEVRVPVEALDGAFHGEEMTVSVNATANGFSKGICLLLISDRTLPDAVPGAISLDSYEVMPGGDIRVSAEIRNDGNALMPDAATVDFFISGQNTFTATAMTSAPIAPAGKATVTAVIKAPSVPGRYGLTARVNDAVTFAELTAANNASETVWFTVLSPFLGSAATDRSVYNTGDEVTITGRTPSYSGEVEVYVTDGSIREAIAVTADADGSFSVKWTPRSGGAYAAGVCVPGEKKTDAMCEFDVRGLKFAESSYITFDMTCGDSRTVNLTVRNMSPVALENISLTAADVPGNCRVAIGGPVSIDAYSSAEIPLTVEALEVSPGSDWQTFRLTVSDGDGLADTKTMYYYGRSARASLLSSVSSINTSMTMGQTRTYSFVIANNGKAATGDITLSLPAFMRMQTAATLPSLEHGEKAEVVLSMTPSPEMQLNVPVSGQIGVNCAYGDGLAIPYSVEPVSDTTGRLVVDARDEYTFYTEEAPHVAGADVMVSHPVTGRMIDKGKTGEDGVWACELPAGYYKIDVSADRHSSWSGTLEIAAGRDNDVPVFLGFNAISYSWTVEETTVDDTYEIVNTVEFETRVPKPVILVNFPELTYSNQIAYITVTNKGLIEAHNVHVLVPESDAAISFELLGDNLYETLGAGQSIFVPMRVSVPYEDPEQKLRMSASSYSYTAEYDASEAAAASAAAPAMAAARASSGECKAHPCYVLVDDYDCDPLTGEPIYNGKKKAIEGTYYTGNCSGPGLPGFGGGGGWRPGGPGGGPGGNTTYNPPPSRPGVKVDSDKNSTYLPDRLRTILTTGCLSNCEKALADAIKACWDAVQSCRGKGDWADFDPQECAENLIDACLPDEPAETRAQAIDQSLDCGKNAAGCFPPLACPADVFDCIRKAYKAFQECMKLYKHLHQDQAPALNGKAPALNDDQALEQTKELRAESVDLMARMYLARIDNLRNLLGDGNWTAATMSDIAGMLDWVQQHRDAQGYIAMDESRLQGKPATVSTATYDSFLERINNSVRSTLEGTPADNVIDLARSRSNHDEMLAVVDRVDELGYPNYDAFADAAAENFNKYLEMGKEPSAGVCASITLKFTQTLVMTRQAFRGTLSITNGNDKNAMTDIRLTLKVRDEEGNLAGEREFAITPESLDGFDGELSFTDGWSLKAGGTGEATVLFIPSRHAAPVEPRVYSFGGVLSYVDPFTGSEVSRELSPIDMTVSPSPLLDLTYFMQRDIIADDPLTPEVIESQEPAEFALLIDNKGFGVGRNVRITTRQPEIVDNRKGLAIDFEIISAMLNGRNSVLALGGDVATDFGDIEPQSSVYAQWWFRSSLMGHFIDYDVKATQLSAYGSEDMSLLDRVEVHELIHGLTPEGAPEARAFLVNDIDDMDCTPDMLYFSDGSDQAEVSKAASATYSDMTDNVCEISVSPGQGAHWTYGVVTDSQFARRKVASVVRLSDNAELPADNFWTSFVTLRNSTAPKYEDRLHFVVRTDVAERYRVTFQPKPQPELAVAAVNGVPDEKTVLRSPLEKVSVRFNKAIDETTFTAADVALRCQGKVIDCSALKIARSSDWTDSNISYDLFFGSLTSQSGYYTLRVDCAGISDSEGFTGSTAGTAAWNQLADGKVDISVEVTPAEGGEVSPSGARYDFGEQLTFKASAAEGYDFAAWMEDGVELSRDESLDYTVRRDAILTASFVLRRYNVDITFDAESGHVSGAASGIYGYGTVLELLAEPADCYQFAGWYCDGEVVSAEPQLRHTVDGPCTIEARFMSQGSGVSEAVEDRLRVYPVPVADRLYVDGSFDTGDTLSFTDARGARVVVMTGLRRGVPVNVSSLAAGVYVVRLMRRDGTSAVARIVKL